MNIYKVVIVDDHHIFRSGLKMLLNQIINLKTVADVSNAIELFDILSQLDIDLIFMDIKMPDMDGILATKEIRKLYPSIKIIALTMFDDQKYFTGMINAGVEGYLLKNTDQKEIEKAINLVLTGKNYYSEKLLAKFSKKELSLLDNDKSNYSTKLTRRENEILKLICKGLSNNNIAKVLNISNRTVQGHRANLIAKTNSKNSIELVLFAIKQKLITVD